MPRSNVSSVSSVSRNQSVVPAGQDTQIFSQILDLNFRNKDDLKKHLLDATERLATLKRDDIVLAKTRTVKRLLDHVKIEGSQNLSTQARKRINLTEQEMFCIGMEVTKLRDEIDEKERELSELTALLARRERDLYESSVLHNTLEMKAKKDDTESQAHVLEYANRNNELTQKIRKIEAAIYQEQRIYERTVRELEEMEIKMVELSKPKPLPPKKQVTMVRDPQDEEAENEWIPKLKERLRMKQELLAMKKAQLGGGDVGDLKKTLADAMRNIVKLRKSNDELNDENKQITDRINNIKSKMGGGLGMSGDIQASAKIKGADQLQQLKAKNQQLLDRLNQLRSPQYNQVPQRSSDQDERIRRILENAQKTDADVDNFIKKTQQKTGDEETEISKLPKDQGLDSDFDDYDMKSDPRQPNNRSMRTMGVSVNPAPFSGPAKQTPTVTKRVSVNQQRTTNQTRTRTSGRTGGLATPAIPDMDMFSDMRQNMQAGNVSAGRNMGSDSDDNQTGNFRNGFNQNQSNNTGYSNQGGNTGGSYGQSGSNTGRSGSYGQSNLGQTGSGSYDQSGSNRGQSGTNYGGTDRGNRRTGGNRNSNSGSGYQTGTGGSRRY